MQMLPAIMYVRLQRKCLSLQNAVPPVRVVMPDRACPGTSRGVTAASRIPAAVSATAGRRGEEIRGEAERDEEGSDR